MFNWLGSLFNNKKLTPLSQEDLNRGYTLTPLTPEQQASAIADPYGSYSFSGVGNTSSTLGTSSSTRTTTPVRSSAPAGGSTPQSQPSSGVQMPTYQGPSDEELNAIYAPGMNYLNTLQATEQARVPEQEAALKKQYELGQQEQQAGFDKSYKTIDNEEQAAAEQKLNAQARARRIYGELIQAGQNRFGGGSSAGEAYAALIGRETASNMGQAENNYIKRKVALGDSRVELDKFVSLEKTKSQTRFDDAMKELRYEFQNKMMEIDRRRGELEAAKAERKLEALTEARARATSLQESLYAYQKQLELYREQNSKALYDDEVELEKRRIAEQGLGTRYADTMKTYQMNPSAWIAPTSSNQSGGIYNYQGIITNDKTDDDYFRNLLG